MSSLEQSTRAFRQQRAEVVPAPRKPFDFGTWALRVVVLGLAIIFALFPVIWIISASFNTTGSMVSQKLIPQNVESVNELLINYRDLFNNPQIPFWRWMGNS